MRRPSTPVGHALAALAALAALSVAPDARAFCRSTTCKTTDDCGQPIPPECKPLKWDRRCVGFAIQRDASVELPYQVARDTTNAAFAAWMQADCDGYFPGLVVQDLGKVVCDKVEFNLTTGNVNVVVFRDGQWPHEDGSHNLALTTVTFDPGNGDMFNADIEVNTAGYDFSDAGENDFLSVLTHEAGHFLGLSHSAVMEATMYFSYTPGSTNFRTLEPDDVAAICTVYPPREIDPETCNPIPRHGFSSECGAEQIAGCSVAPSPEDGARSNGREGGERRAEPAPGPLGPLGAALALAAAWARRRRRAPT